MNFECWRPAGGTGIGFPGSPWKRSESEGQMVRNEKKKGSPVDVFSGTEMQGSHR